MRYNTGNPVGPDGSSSPFDLNDNAGVLDLLLNGPLGEYLSRLSVPLKSWAGLQAEFLDRIVAMGNRHYATTALMNADLSPPAGVIAIVTNDPAAEKSGWYYKVGASNTGSWEWIPNQPVLASDYQVLRNSVDVLEGIAGDAPTVMVDGRPMARASMGSDGSVLDAVGQDGVAYRQEAGGLVRSDRMLTPLMAPGVTVPGIGMASLIYQDDATGRVLGGITAAGVSFSNKNGVLALEAQKNSAYLKSGNPFYAYRTADSTIVDIWVAVGQSLAAGENPDTSDATVSGTPQHVGDAFTFARGASVGYTGYNYPLDGLGGLREVPFSYSAAGNVWESVSSRFGWTLLDKMAASGVGKQKVMCFSVGRGGMPWKDLTRGGDYYSVFLNALSAARDLLSAQGLTPRLRGLLVIHGEADTGNGTGRHKYRKMLNTWRVWAQEDAKTIFGQNQCEVEMFASQCCQGDGGTMKFKPMPISLAQLDADNFNNYTTTVGPIYWVPSAAGNVTHPSAIGYARMGEMFADAVFKKAYSGQSYVPIYITESIFTDQTHIRLTYSADIAIEADDSIINLSALGSGKGFDFTDGSASPPAISSVTVVGAREIEITLSAAPLGAFGRLFYAHRQTAGSVSMSQTSYRGGVRSLAPFMTSTVNGVDNYHWACHQIINIGEYV